jgi:hypothetical protein
MVSTVCNKKPVLHKNVSVQFNNFADVQVCDATGDAQSFWSRLQKINTC